MVILNFGINFEIPLHRKFIKNSLRQHAIELTLKSTEVNSMLYADLPHLMSLKTDDSTNQ